MEVGFTAVNLGDPAQILDRAVQDMRLPSGAGLAFVPVGPLAGVCLPDRIQRCAPRRQAGYVAGRLAACTALRRAGHAEPAPPGIGDDGLPLWPRGWIGSISHTDDIAAALVAPAPTAGLLGLDIEAVMGADLAAEIAPETLPELSNLNATDVTKGFSAKEALYKALYPLTGQFRTFSAAEILLMNPVRLRLAEDWGPKCPEGMIFEAEQRVAAGHVVTVLWR